MTKIYHHNYLENVKVRQVNTSYLQKHHILEKWDKLTTPSLWNEGKHHDNAKGDKLTAKSIENEFKHLKMQKWDKWTLPTYKSITLWESAISLQLGTLEMKVNAKWDKSQLFKNSF